MAKHTVSDTNPARVVGADQYRISFTATLSPSHEGFDSMQEFFRSEHRRPEGYGLVGLESEEHSVLYSGSVQQIEEYRAAAQLGPTTFDGSQGHMYEFWPHGQGWDTFIPRTFWNAEAHGAIADGVGLVTTFPHSETLGAEVVVYEFEGSWLLGGKPEQMVTHHCTACHKDTHHDSGHVHANTGPDSRRWAARQARQHIISAHRHGVGNTNSACRPTNGAMLRAVNAVARDLWGTTGNALPDTDDAYCATKGPCSLIRELRAGVRPPVYRA
ncbi:hypothetical protein ACWEV4_29650 [Streptomyces sp. NPDC003860]